MTCCPACLPAVLSQAASSGHLEVQGLQEDPGWWCLHPQVSAAVSDLQCLSYRSEQLQLRLMQGVEYTGAVNGVPEDSSLGVNA